MSEKPEPSEATLKQCTLGDAHLTRAVRMALHGHDPLEDTRSSLGKILERVYAAENRKKEKPA